MKMLSESWSGVTQGHSIHCKWASYESAMLLWVSWEVARVIWGWLSVIWVGLRVRLTLEWCCHSQWLCKPLLQFESPGEYPWPYDELLLFLWTIMINVSIGAFICVNSWCDFWHVASWIVDFFIFFPKWDEKKCWNTLIVVYSIDVMMLLVDIIFHVSFSIVNIFELFLKPRELSSKWNHSLFLFDLSL